MITGNLKIITPAFKVLGIRIDSQESLGASLSEGTGDVLQRGREFEEALDCSFPILGGLS